MKPETGFFRKIDKNSENERQPVVEVGLMDEMDEGMLETLSKTSVEPLLDQTVSRSLYFPFILTMRDARTSLDVKK